MHLDVVGNMLSSDAPVKVHATLETVDFVNIAKPVVGHTGATGADVDGSASGGATGFSAGATGSASGGATGSTTGSTGFSTGASGSGAIGQDLEATGPTEDVSEEIVSTTVLTTGPLGSKTGATGCCNWCNWLELSNWCNWLSNWCNCNEYAERATVEGMGLDCYEREGSFDSS